MKIKDFKRWDNRLKIYLHRKYGWFKCLFSQLDAREKILGCKMCGKKFEARGYPYINMVLTEIKS